MRKPTNTKCNQKNVPWNSLKATFVGVHKKQPNRIGSPFLITVTLR